ncbi:hypothetical protein [Bacillus atrophaeus]|uniref:hypothetical protein n=1 Tax=Bacillus atrophaeus TaxID=1452 RepID=UPI002282B33D|nr:hypothetical protein [Bacillus atrophaeus]MCY8465627.1 hypothetical protein [Bacillus atrophaeus]MCY8478789.1 hypothetical protein [Bacillus atrophaeus]
MKLPIEQWLDKQEFNENIKQLFEESIICYKASAYRASLLFSYLGFQSVIKDRILRADKPEKINEHTWNAIHKNLRKEDSWDTEVNECIKKSDDNHRLFNITEDLRQQAIYWKNRRNDCAHSKPNTISHSHVESFWLFLFSNLSKFVVNGGMNALLHKIEKHFDQNFTNKQADFKDLIQEVPHTVHEEEMERFLYELDVIFINHEDDYPYSYSERVISFLNELIRIGSPVSEKTIEFIKQSKFKLEESFLGKHPEHITNFYSDRENVRNFWRTKLIYMESHKFTILTALLRNNLIESEKNEAIDFFIKNISARRNSLSTELIHELKFHGYFERYKQLVFLERLIDNFPWANDEGRHTIVEHLNILGLDEEIVKSINETFDFGNFPYKMRRELKEYFIDPIKNQEYKNISESLGLKPTETLGF